MIEREEEIRAANSPALTDETLPNSGEAGEEAEEEWEEDFNLPEGAAGGSSRMCSCWAAAEATNDSVRGAVIDESGMGQNWAEDEGVGEGPEELPREEEESQGLFHRMPFGYFAGTL